MEALAGYGSDSSEDESESINVGENPAKKAETRSPTHDGEALPSVNRLNQCLPPPTLSSDSMVHWDNDFFSLKYKDQDPNSTESTGVTLPMLALHSTKPVNWIQTLKSDASFTNPHQIQEVVDQLGIQQSLTSLEDLSEWENADRICELEQQALINAQKDYQQNR